MDARDANSHLARGIPNLKLNLLATELNRANLEVNTDGGDVALSVGVVSEAEEQAGLAHARITDEKELEEVVAVVVSTTVKKNLSGIAYYSVFIVEKGVLRRGHEV